LRDFDAGKKPVANIVDDWCLIKQNPRKSAQGKTLASVASSSDDVAHFCREFFAIAEMPFLYHRSLGACTIACAQTSIPYQLFRD
jgi:hypothetical protein